MSDEPKPESTFAPFVEWVGAMPTDDGEHVIARFKPSDDPAITVALAEPDVINVAMSLIGSAGQARAKRGVQGDITIVETGWWNVDAHPNGTHLVISFRLPGELRLGFLVHRGQAQGLIAGISVAAELPVQPAPAGPKH
jgi:hypothetical protein